MALKDLRSALNGTLKLPINGTTYEVQPISAAAGLRFQEIMAIAQKSQQAKAAGKDYTPADDDVEVLNDQAERDMYRDALGDAYDLMIEDGVQFAELKLAALYVTFHAVYGEEFAETYWNAGGKAPARNRAERRTATRTRTGAASTTKKPASRTGTTTRKATPKTAG